MKLRVAFLALPCLILTGLFSVAAPTPENDSPKVEAAALRTPETRASRFVPVETTTTEAPTTTVAPTTTTAAPTTTTAKPTTTTAKPKPKPSTTTPKPAAKAATAPVAHGDWMALIKQYPWDANHAYRIMMCESGGNPNARNPHSTATGLFQILGGPTDPQANVALAYKMYSTRGWQPWVCRG